MTRPQRGGTIARRRRAPDEASGGEIARREGEVAAEPLAARAAAELQARFGNARVLAALSGADRDGLDGLIADRLAQGVAGVEAEPLGGVARAARGAGGAEVDAGAVVREGGGAPLPDVVRARMESAFGHDFGHVRIHTDGDAARAAEAISAHAFTVGSHVWFGAGEWAPGTPDGDRLIAHELTHVVQHDRGEAPSGGGGEVGGVQVSSPSDRTEVEAYANEDRILARLAGREAAPEPAAAPERAAGGAAPGAGPATVSRSGDEEAPERPPPDFDIGAALAEAMTAAEEPIGEAQPDAEPVLEPAPTPEAAEPVEPAPASAPPPSRSEGPVCEPAEPITAVATASEAPVMSGPAGFSPSVALGVPWVDAAQGVYFAQANDASLRISGSVVVNVARVEGAAAAAASSATAAAESLRAHVSSAITGAIAQVRADAEAARQAVRDSLQTRLDELTAVCEVQRDAVLARSAEHAEAIRTLYGRLADDAEAHGESKAQALLDHAEAQAELTRAAASAVVAEYAEHDRANDIRITVGRMAGTTAERVLGEARTAAEGLREDGVALADKLRADGEAFERNITDGDEDTRRLFDDLLVEAQDALDGSGDDTLSQIDDLERAAVGQLEALEATLTGHVDLVEAQQLQGIAAARADVVAGLGEAGRRAEEALSAQVATVETWLQTAHPSQWPLVVDVLEQLTDQLLLQTDACVAGLDGMADTAVASFDTAGSEAVGAIAEAATEIDARISEIQAELARGLDEVSLEFEQTLLDQTIGFEDAWRTEADAKIADLDAAWEEARGSLQTTYDDGIAEIDGQYDEAVAELDEVVASARADFASKADEIANQSWWDRFVSGLKSFALGLLDALWDFVKVIGIILLVVVAVVLVVALVILIVKGAAVLGAVAAAAAAFLAAAAKVLAIVGLVLTVVSVVFAVVSAAAAWLNPDLTTDEKWRATGKSVGDILLEFVPDFGIGLLTRADDVGDVARAVENVDDVVRGGENLEDLASGVRGVEQAANGTEELADLAADAGRVADDADEAAALVNAADEAADAADAMGDVTRAGDAADAAADAAHAEDIARAGDGAQDATRGADEAAQAADDAGRAADEVPQPTAPSPQDLEAAANRGADPRAAFEVHRANGYGGEWETFLRQWDKGLRLEGRPRRWIRPRPEAAADVPEATTDAVRAADEATEAAQGAASASDEAAQVATDTAHALEGGTPTGSADELAQASQGATHAADEATAAADDAATAATRTDGPAGEAVDAVADHATDAAQGAGAAASGAEDVGRATEAAGGGFIDEFLEGWRSYDPETAPEWWRKQREAARLLAEQENIVHPRLQAAYDLFKGIAMSLYQAWNGLPDFVTNLGTIGQGVADRVSEAQSQADAIEQEARAAGDEQALAEEGR